MEINLPPKELRKRIREVIKKQFVESVERVKEGPGTLTDFAKQIGISRQALSAYAEGSVPESDVLLAAIFCWEWEISIETESHRIGWRTLLTPGTPAQLSLFEDQKEGSEFLNTSTQDGSSD